MIDELTRAGAADVLSSGLLRVKTMVATDRGVTPRVIRAFGERATELLSTMLQNMRNPENPRFVASISGTTVSAAVMPLLRKEVANKGGEFLADIHDSFLRDTNAGSAKKRTTGTNRVGVTIFIHEAQRKAKPKKEAVKKRQNFRRGP
jgi:hypothetical protein